MTFTLTKFCLLALRLVYVKWSLIIFLRWTYLKVNIYSKNTDILIMVCKHLNLTRRKCFLKYYSDLHYYSPTKMLFPFQKQIASRTLVIWHWLYIILEHGDMGDVVKWLTCSYRRSLIICQYGRRQMASSSHSFLVLRGWICHAYEIASIDLLLSSYFKK